MICSAESPVSPTKPGYIFSITRKQCFCVDVFDDTQLAFGLYLLALGVLARTAHRSPEWKEKPAADQNVMQRYVPFRRTGKRTLRGGAEIQ
jgi:hypothetical protein